MFDCSAHVWDETKDLKMGLIWGLQSHMKCYMRVQMDQVVKFIVPDRILELIIPVPVQSKPFISIQRYFRTGRNYRSLTESSSLCISLLCPIFNMQIKAEHCRKVRYSLMFSIFYMYMCCKTRSRPHHHHTADFGSLL